MNWIELLTIALVPILMILHMFKVLRMKHLVLLSQVLFLALGLVGCQSAMSSKSEYWHNRAAQIQVGSTRREVEKLLTPVSPSSGMSSGSTQVELYWVDEEWQVCIVYDPRGNPEDRRNIFGNRKTPQDKVRKVPILSNGKIPEPYTR